MSKRKKRWLIGGLLLLLALVAFRLYLPVLIRTKVNEKLASLEGYDGRVEKIGLSLLRGGYRIHGLKIVKEGIPAPFFSAELIAFTVDWGPLFRGKIVSDIYIGSPRINIVKLPGKGFESGPKQSLPATLRSLTPFDINRLEVKNGRVHYQDFDSDPKIDVALTKIYATARNLRNTRTSEELPADIELKAKALETGDLAVSLKADPLKKAPTFDLKQTLSGVELSKFNDLLDAYAKVKVKTGVFGLYVEVAAKEGKFIGYAKPVFTDLVLDKKAEGKPLKQVWAAVASAVKWVFENKKKDQLATKIPIEGEFGEADVGIWEAVGGILKNAYIKALSPSLDKDGVDLKDVNKVKK